jgi:arabinose-5-phosphate isomerase
VIAIEADAVRALGDRLGKDFDRTVELVTSCRGRVVVTGMGKSGIIARKIAATLASTGTPALFLHPAEAVHGDLGMIVDGDVVLAVSSSGETEELIRLLETIRRLGASLVVMTGVTDSTLGRRADRTLDVSVQDEGCPIGLAPMASAAAALAMGDALAAAVMTRKGFGADRFAELHPGGRLGKRLKTVEELMHQGDRLPRVAPSAPMRDAILVMTRHKLGCTTVVEPGTDSLAGLITDGDLRRLFERAGNPLDVPAAEAMTASPVTIAPDQLASAALKIMEERKITMLPVVRGDGQLVGVLHIHDLWRVQLF